MSTEDAPESYADPVLTTENLKFAIPTKAKLWGIQVFANEKGPWRRLAAPRTEGQGPGPGKGCIELDELAVETIRQWWGPGLYRILWLTAPGRPRLSQTPPFRVLGADDEPEEQPQQIAVSPPVAPHKLATATAGEPPLEQVDPVRYMSARDASGMQLFLQSLTVVRETWGAMQIEAQRQLRLHREFEAQRSQEHMAYLELQRAQIQADAQVRIAEADARARAIADASTERTASLADELQGMRELVQASMSAARDGDESAATDMIRQLEERIAELENEEDPPEGQGALVAIATTLLEQLGPVVKQFADAKLKQAGASVAAAIDAT